MVPNQGLTSLEVTVPLGQSCSSTSVFDVRKAKNANVSKNENFKQFFV
jgi:hypothetical protein